MNNQLHTHCISGNGFMDIPHTHMYQHKAYSIVGLEIFEICVAYMDSRIYAILETRKMLHNYQYPQPVHMHACSHTHARRYAHTHAHAHLKKANKAFTCCINDHAYPGHLYTTMKHCGKAFLRQDWYPTGYCTMSHDMWALKVSHELDASWIYLAFAYTVTH